ncbi:MAG: FAD-dependent oxidoreductase [Myxococcota bacterium]|jgi:2-polyprenyl-6-methoxyphenol hydroxylase-like FAD-dependent oxidoreductase
MVDVLIVGAGPVGLFLALLLRRQGLDVALIERRAGPVFDPRAAIIWPRTAEVLAAQGLAPAFTAEMRRLEGVEFNVRGVRRGALRLRGLEGPESLPWIIEQHRTEALLRGALGDLQVRDGHTLTGLTQTAEGVTARVRTPSGEAEVEARFVVGCDGAHSAVRKLLGIEFAGRAHEGLECLQVNAECEWERPPPSGFCRFDLVPNATLLAVPLPERGYRFVSFQRARGPLQQPTLADAEAQLSRIAGQPLELALTTPQWLTRARFQDRVATQLRRGRVLLCGDAAAVWAPIGGRGMNVGLLAAHHLGRALTLVAHGEANEAVLDHYSDEVRAMVRRVMRTLRWNRLEYPSSALALWFIDRALSVTALQQVVPRPIERLLSLTSLDRGPERRFLARHAAAGGRFRALPAAP